jgi:hypothetical protein
MAICRVLTSFQQKYQSLQNIDTECNRCKIDEWFCPGLKDGQVQLWHLVCYGLKGDTGKIFISLL